MIADALRNARKASGLTQEALAEKAGVHRTYISLLERNKKSPTIEVLLRLCSALGVRASHLLAQVEEAKR